MGHTGFQTWFLFRRFQTVSSKLVPESPLALLYCPLNAQTFCTFWAGLARFASQKCSESDAGSRMQKDARCAKRSSQPPVREVGGVQPRHPRRVAGSPRLRCVGTSGQGANPSQRLNASPLATHVPQSAPPRWLAWPAPSICSPERTGATRHPAHQAAQTTPRCRWPGQA